MKCCKIIVTYFSNKRRSNLLSPLNRDISLKLFSEYVIPNEYKFYPMDLDMDLIIVNHIPDFRFEKSEEYIKSIDNNNIGNGKIITRQFKNTGSPFTAYSEIWKEFNTEYDYYMFQEDDHIMISSGYYMDSIKKLESTDYKFIAFAPISFNIAKHSGGAFGITSSKTLSDVSINGYNDGNGHLSIMNPNVKIKNHEVEFTNSIIRYSGDICYLDKFNPSPVNYKQHSLHNKYNVDRSKQYFYAIGIDYATKHIGI